jgi:hypothetical protein
MARCHNFHVELVPVHSPLLRESCLVSFPPLTYMLKFSGFPNLTSCLALLQKQQLRGKSVSNASAKKGEPLYQAESAAAQ